MPSCSATTPPPPSQLPISLRSLRASWEQRPSYPKSLPACERKSALESLELGLRLRLYLVTCIALSLSLSLSLSAPASHPLGRRERYWEQVWELPTWRWRPTTGGRWCLSRLGNGFGRRYSPRPKRLHARAILLYWARAQVWTQGRVLKDFTLEVWFRNMKQKWKCDVASREGWNPSNGLIYFFSKMKCHWFDITFSMKSRRCPLMETLFVV